MALAVEGLVHGAHAPLAERTAMSAGELQLRIADLRDHGVVRLD